MQKKEKNEELWIYNFYKTTAQSSSFFFYLEKGNILKLNNFAVWCV